MSEESLRSLKYCLGWLRWANEHIGKVILALKQVLEQYDHGSESSASGVIEENGNGWTHQNEKGGVQANGQLVVRSDAERSALNAIIAELKNDVLKTLKEVVDIVSKYAGGALPENARILVRKHLTSLPQRFRLASSATVNGTNGERPDREVTEGANRVMVLAKEGLDMMAQVSGVLDGTIVSAEEWCERTWQEEARGGRARAEPWPEPHADGGRGREREAGRVRAGTTRDCAAGEGVPWWIQRRCENVVIDNNRDFQTKKKQRKKAGTFVWNERRRICRVKTSFCFVCTGVGMDVYYLQGRLAWMDGWARAAGVGVFCHVYTYHVIR